MCSLALLYWRYSFNSAWFISIIQRNLMLMQENNFESTYENTIL